MDTTTVLQIIKMIDSRLSILKNERDNGELSSDDYFPAKAELESLGNHLQEYIEGQISAMENSTQE